MYWYSFVIMYFRFKFMLVEYGLVDLYISESTKSDVWTQFDTHEIRVCVNSEINFRPDQLFEAQSI